jgi:hypothetical protein
MKGISNFVYMATNHRQTKAKIAKAIVDSVFVRNGRFLKKMEAAELQRMGFANVMDVYTIVDDDTVMEKAKQALRQNCEKATSTGSTTTAGVEQDAAAATLSMAMSPDPKAVSSCSSSSIPPNNNDHHNLNNLNHLSSIGQPPLSYPSGGGGEGGAGIYSAMSSRKITAAAIALTEQQETRRNNHTQTPPVLPRRPREKGFYVRQSSDSVF